MFRCKKCASESAEANRFCACGEFIYSTDAWTTTSSSAAPQAASTGSPAAPEVPSAEGSPLTPAQPSVGASSQPPVVPAERLAAPDPSGSSLVGIGPVLPTAMLGGTSPLAPLPPLVAPNASAASMPSRYASADSGGGSESPAAAMDHAPPDWFRPPRPSSATAGTGAVSGAVAPDPIQAEPAHLPNLNPAGDSQPLRAGQMRRRAPQAAASVPSTFPMPGPPAGTTADNSAFRPRSPDEARLVAPNPGASTPPQIESKKPQGLVLTLDRTLMNATPGSAASLQVTIANTGRLVEGCTLEVNGIPDTWLRVDPPQFNLDVDATRQVTLHLTPPRSHESVAGSAAMAVRVVSLVNSAVMAEIPFTLMTEAYSDVKLDLDPAELEGKRSARTYLSIRNNGNLPERLTLSGSEAAHRLRFTFSPEFVEIPKGKDARVILNVSARRRHWSRGEKFRSFSVLARRSGGTDLPPAQGRFSQLSSAPRGVMPVLLVALAILVPLGAITFARNLKKHDAADLVSVPKVEGLTESAAIKKIENAGLVANSKKVPTNDSAADGIVRSQDPTGVKLARSEVVTIVVTTLKRVPQLKGETIENATRILANSGLKIDIVNRVLGTIENHGQVSFQLEQPGEVAKDDIVHVDIFAAPAFEMPCVVGKNFVEVEAQLARSGAKVVSEPTASEEPRNVVLQQFPPPGEPITSASKITLNVSTGTAGAKPEPAGTCPKP
jgi:beta-lactam-binding protein with PASTA domain